VGYLLLQNTVKEKHKQLLLGQFKKLGSCFDTGFEDILKIENIDFIEKNMNEIGVAIPRILFNIRIVPDTFIIKLLKKTASFWKNNANLIKTNHLLQLTPKRAAVVLEQASLETFDKLNWEELENHLLPIRIKEPDKLQKIKKKFANKEILMATLDNVSPELVRAIPVPTSVKDELIQLLWCKAMVKHYHMEKEYEEKLVTKIHNEFTKYGTYDLINQKKKELGLK